MNKNHLVSIIVPVYNVENYVSQCLDSLLNQTYSNLEIICVDDGSTDSSFDILISYAKKDNRIKIFQQTNQGQSFARNDGLSHVTGDYVTFIDSDDWIEQNYIERLLFLALDNKYDAVMCSYIREYKNKSLKSHIFDTSYFELKGEEVQRKLVRRFFGPIDKELKNPANYDAPISACMQLFKTEIALSSRFADIREIGSFEDGLYQICIYQKCFSFCYIDEHLYHYRKFNSNSTTTKYRERLFEQWNNLYDKMMCIANQSIFQKEYFVAFQNRISLGMIGLCINEQARCCSSRERSKRLKHIISSERYSKALSSLDTQIMPLKWRFFFSLCKKKHSFLLAMLSKAIVALRGK